MATRRQDKHPMGKPVIVRWIDSMGTTGWGADHKDPAKMECTSVGFLIDSPKDRVIVALNKSHYSHGDMIEIPRHTVRSVKRLKE